MTYAWWRFGILVFAGSAGLAATSARAACFPCDAFPQVAAAQREVAVDGVLVFSFAGWEVSAEQIRPYLTVEVRDAEGASVDGALALHAGFPVISWRPAVPWVAGATYTVVTSLDREQWALDSGVPVDAAQCRVSPLEGEISIDAAPLPPPQAPPVVVDTEHRVTPRGDLEALVCCDGAYPYLDHNQPGACPSPAVEPDGTCRARLASGELEVRYALDLDGLAPAAAANLIGEMSVVLREPGCLRFEALDVARDQVFVDERCHGEALADQLGDLEIDPSAELADACAGEPYVCEVVAERWDPERCDAWPEAVKATDGGCGCRSSHDMAGVALLGLLFARRRRRARP